MKTFEEAVELVNFSAKVVGRENIPAKVEEMKARALEMLQRSEGLMRDATESPAVELMIQGFIALIVERSGERNDWASTEFVLRSSLFSMFMNGLVVGIEMEKQQL